MWSKFHHSAKSIYTFSTLIHEAVDLTYRSVCEELWG